MGRIRSDVLDLHVTMTRSNALALIADAERKRSPFRPEDFSALRPELELAAKNLFDVTSLGRPLGLRSAEPSLSIENEIEFRLLYDRPGPGSLRIRAGHLAKLSPDHGNALTLSQDSPPGVLGVKLLNAADSELEATVAGESSKSGSAPAGPIPSFRSFLALGIEHILTGYDHLLFLAGLLIACRGFRKMLVLVTSFTVAHSITLVSAALDVVSPPDRIVEPLIAASIVFVGVENFLSREEPKRRWAPSFAFGLVHGFGFAGVLRELGLGRDGSSILAPLFAFNLGVEVGQLLIAAIALPLFLKLRRFPAFERSWMRAASAGMALMGVYWFFERSLSG